MSLPTVSALQVKLQHNHPSADNAEWYTTLSSQQETHLNLCLIAALHMRYERE